MKPFFILILFVFLGGQVFANRALNGTVGLGYPEAAIVGLRFEFLQAQIGLQTGFFPHGANSSYFSAGAAAYYHFAGSSYWVKQRPFYTSSGFLYVREKLLRDITSAGYLDLRFGRVMNTSKRMGLEVDAGLGIKLFEELEPATNQNSPPLVRPSLGIRWFFRF